MQTAELFEEHGRMVYGLCRALLRDPDDADDATQVTFISAYKSLLGGNQVREPAAWLATIARNECTARARARMREPLPLVDADLGHTQGPESELDRRAVVEELQQAISELPEKQREAVVLRDLYGLQYTEVSAALGMSVASVESLLFRARRSLRVSLKPLASGVLAVPVAVREGIAQALPGFTTGGAAEGGAASGVVGLGLLAKFTGVPAAVKIAAGVVAITATGSVAVVGAEHAETQHPRSVQASSQVQAAGVGVRTNGSLAGGSLFIPVLAGERSATKGDDNGTEQASNGSRKSDDDGDTATGATARLDGNEDSEQSGSSSGGHLEDGGARGARSGGDDDAGVAGTETRSRHGDGKVEPEGSHIRRRSGDAKVPAGSDDLLHAKGSGSAEGDSSASSGGGSGGEGTAHGGDPDSSGSSGTSEGAGSSGDSEPESSGSSPDNEPTATTPPPA
jgi:RNA polymerase sigma factor (sigma-70 family)